ncbi:hypothetical protein BCR32DRAFT_291487 [Anaeromyces robustus]|uniref:Cyclin-like domain-containing protein n=1 Tax=Anaeromyces robustus TaxID=1754192 RepID=A0A1Y1XEJ2_9FUNG|nr:hypothetical protein BCR32DRAFT_291487 [Anaeromyces robustus]|eukprot:ORX84155.1 hypothetical protein BCR32DRAFT_291487 [Anaeromyces robustus]
MIEKLELFKNQYEKNKLNLFKSRFFPELLNSEQLIKRLRSRNYNEYQIEQLLRYWEAKLIEERNSVVLPWPDQYPSVINKDFTREIRSHSISWIAQVIYDFGFNKETFYVAIKIFDLYLQSEYKIEKKKLCYITPAILFIAIQLEEDEEESKRNLIQELLNTNGYDFLKEVKALQIIICKSLNFQLIVPTAYTWLLLYFQIEACINPHHTNKELQKQYDSEFILELESFNINQMNSRGLFKRQIQNKRFKKALKILDYAMYNTESFLYPSPLLAAACFTMEVPLMNNEYEIITGYSKSQLFPCIQYLYDYIGMLQTIKVNDIFNLQEEDEYIDLDDHSILNIDILRRLDFTRYMFFLNILKREGTVATKLSEQIPDDIKEKKKRSESLLLKLSNSINNGDELEKGKVYRVYLEMLKDNCIIGDVTNI